MIVELIILALSMELVGVIILTRHSDNLLKWLVENRLRVPDTEESYQKQIAELKTEANRKTWGGAVLLGLGFFLQMIGTLA